jgi:hypothetical protein
MEVGVESAAKEGKGEGREEARGEDRDTGLGVGWCDTLALPLGRLEKLGELVLLSRLRPLPLLLLLGLPLGLIEKLGKGEVVSPCSRRTA